jgi:1-deoxy-D-xylulose-5-phosphate synthase
VPADLPAIERRGAVDVLARGEGSDVLLVAVGAMAHLCLDAASRVREQGYGVTVVDPRWVRPVPADLVGLAAEHRLVVSVEDGVRAGGVGDALSKAMRDAGVYTPMRDIGVPVGWHPQGSRGEVLTDLGLTAQDVARQVVEVVSALPGGNGHLPLPTPADRAAVATEAPVSPAVGTPGSAPAGTPGSVTAPPNGARSATR